MALEPGFEPGIAVLETAVFPLHHINGGKGAVCFSWRGNCRNCIAFGGIIIHRLSIKTVRCKLEVTPEQRRSAIVTLEKFAAACNDILAISNAHNTRSKFELQKLCYRDIKTKYGLTSNYVIRALARVAASFGKGKKTPTHYEPTSADLDKDLFRYIAATESISLATIHGRIKAKLVLGNYQRYLLEGQRPSAGVLVLTRSGDLYVNLMIEAPSPDPITPDGILGVDLGINRIATTSDGKRISGRKVNRTRERNQRVKAKLQAKGTKRCKRTLKRLSGKQSRFMHDVNHCISKELVAEALRTNRAIAIEDLTGIRVRCKKKGKRLRSALGGWAFFQLRTFLAYKAESSGIPLLLVDPAYTSQRCSICGSLGSRQKHKFSCSCGHVSDADVNGARNIAAQGQQSICPQVAAA